MPGSFFDTTAPSPRPVPSTSRTPFVHPWAEVTPGQLKAAIIEMGLNAKDMGIGYAIKRVWEESRGAKLEEMVMKVLDKVMA